MTTIYLNQKSGPYSAGSITVSVSEEKDKPCKLFKRYRHTFESQEPIGECLRICKGTSPGAAGDGENCSQEPETCKNGEEKLILNVDGGYESAELQRVDVYFNKYKDTNPLLFVLHFESNGYPSPQDRYYIMSSFEGDKETGKEISKLTKFDGDSSILQPLLKENDNLKELLTFDIGQKARSSTSGGGSYSQYNGNKIRVEDDSGSEPQVSNGFKRYKHTPDLEHRSKNACIIYNKNVLMQKGRTTPIDIQNRQYSTVNAYFGDKEKRTNGGTKDVPLLIELTKNGDGVDYYVHKKNPSDGKCYWEQLPGSQGEELKSLLEDIGLSTNRDGRGHATLKSLLEKASIGNGDDLSSKLRNATGAKLKTLLEQKVNGSKSLLLLLLARVEFNLVDSVVILLGQRGIGVSYTGYNYVQIGDAVENLDPRRDVNRIKNGDDNVVLKDKTNENGKCVKDLNYNVMEHDFSKYVQELKSPEQEWAGLRFLIPAANSGKYKDLSLYDSTGPENLVYKYYRKVGTNGSKVYVVFYGSDKRPLMICYGGDAYIPWGKDKYNTEWVKVEGVTRCVCPDTGDIAQNEALLKALTEVVGFLNEVDLSKHPTGAGNGGKCNTGSGVASETTCTSAGQASSSNSCTYDVHQYNGQQVKISVKCEAVTINGKTCYRKLIHEPAGINGQGTAASGFRLGNVVYNNGGVKKGSINYYKENGPEKGDNQSSYWLQPLVSVSAYFYDQDNCYKDPLLVVLEFKNGAGADAGPKECYKLTKRGDSNMTWERDTGASTVVPSGGQDLVKHLDSIRYNIKKVLRVEINKQGQYPSMGRNSSTTSGNGNNGFEQLNGKQVTVQECSEGTCPKLSKQKYKCFQHKISELGADNLYKIGGVEFTIPSANGVGNPIEIKLYNTTGGSAPDCTNGQSGQITQLTYNKCMGDIYVYFFGEDPRPLLLCYNGNAYRPRKKDCYFEKWVKDDNISKCVCTEPVEDENKLLDALTYVVGFLNEVDLSKHPTGTGNGECTGASSVVPSEGRSSTCTATNGNTCTYDVHQYKSQKVQIKVTCSDVTPTSSGNKCYRKLTHEPMGMNGTGRTGAESGFRLGNVVYNGKGGGSPQGSIDYYPYGLVNGDDHPNKFKPLIRVGAYFYDADKEYQDPLLVVLEFKNNGVGAGTNDKEYYKLTRREPGKMEWQKDTENAKTKVGNPSELVKHLDEIRYKLKKVLKVEISEKTQYQAMGREASGKNGFEQLQNGEKQKNIDVTDCKNGTCKKLSENNYKCVVHKISQLGEGFDYNLIGGVAFTIPGQGGNVIEIPLYNGNSKEAEDNCKPGTNGEPGEKGKIQLFYNSCMGDVYVFFYDKGGGSPDTVPLMLWFNKNYYRPCDRDSYFTKWVPVKELLSVGEPCELGDGGEKLAKELEKVNKELNRIELDKSSMARSGTGSYGLPDQGTGTGIKPNESFKTMRVKVTEKQPTNENAKTAYTRIVHRTVNGFTIGDIKYGGNEIVASGVSINGGSGGGVGAAEIKVKNGGHTSLVAGKKCNTVVAYYSKTDENFQLPQLIVILKTDKPVSKDDPVTASETGYGYYILSAKNGSGSSNNVSKDYEYVWRPVTNGPGKQTPVTLDDETDFSLLNSIVILLEHRPNNGEPVKYNDVQIKDAISKAKLKSPGRSNEINRITGKPISVSDETVSKAKCLNGTGFKLITHDISALVSLDGSSLKGKLVGVTLIAGLRFMIPTPFRRGGEYRQLILSESSSSSDAGNGSLQHYLYYQNSNKKVSIFFYKEDPRPLLLCYNDKAYRPIGKITYLYSWDKDKTISNCACKGGACDDGGECHKLLMALIKVSDFLNPVKIKNVPIESRKCRFYNIHWFNGNLIKIKVESKKSDGTFCYHRYTHTHNGIGSGGTGFRLGTINYNGTCIEKNNSTGGKNGNCITSVLDEGSPYTAASKVVVFYYQGDNKLERPLLVALCENSSNDCTVYYELQKGDGSSNVKKYTKGKNGPIDVNDTTPNGKLDTILGRILSENNNWLQIIIDKIPKPILVCYPQKKEETKNGKNKDNGKNSIPPKLPKPDCQDRRSDEGSDILLRPASYKAQLYNKDGNPLPNGTTTNTNAGTTTVNVSQIKCDQLSRRGYRCYEHQITGVTNVEQIGGLKFFLWDNTNKGQGGPECSSSNTSGGASNSKELCLYKETSAPNSAGSSAACTASVPSSQQPAQSNCTAPGETLQLVTTSYTTCKGNVYVFFYGDDPRPLLLCYAGSAYGPMCVEEYACRWVCVATGCGVTVKEVRFISYFSLYVDVVRVFYKNDCTKFSLTLTPVLH